MRLHNRQVKASFWNDPDLLQWPREKRMFYLGLIQLADDSGCLENSPFAFKINLFPSPVDSDITMDLLATWRDELIKEKKLVRYQAGDKHYLYLVKFHKHQTVKNADAPSVPLPPWIKWETFPSTPHHGKYILDAEVLQNFSNSSSEVLQNFSQPEPEPEPIKEEEEVSARARKQEPCQDGIVEKIAGALAGAGILVPSPIQVEKLMHFVDSGMDVETIEYACEVAALANARRVDYIEGVLKNWQASGVRTKKQAEAERENFTNKKKKHPKEIPKYPELPML